MNKFKSLAQSATSISELMNGKTKLTTADVIANFPDGITITAIDVVRSANDKHYAVVSFAEEPTAFYCGGVVLTKIVDSWLDEYNGDSGMCNHDLGESGGVKVKLATARTKDGKNVTTIEVV